MPHELPPDVAPMPPASPRSMRPPGSPVARFFGKPPAWVMWHGMTLVIAGFVLGHISGYLKSQDGTFARIWNNLFGTVQSVGLLVVATAMLTVVLHGKDDRWFRIGLVVVTMPFLYFALAGL